MKRYCTIFFLTFVPFISFSQSTDKKVEVSEKQHETVTYSNNESNTVTHPQNNENISPEAQGFEKINTNGKVIYYKKNERIKIKYTPNY